MTDNHAKSQRSSLAVWLIVGLVLLPALYVLAIGPMQWCIRHGYVNDYGMAVLSWIYTPIRYLHGHSDVCRVVLDSYMQLWGG
jgi:hypothetical protein